jgi:hypothetical protein
MAISFSHQIVDGTSALSQPMIDELILGMWMERPSTQCVGVELRSIWRTNFKGIIVCTNSKFDNFDHFCDGFLDQLRNRLIVKDWTSEIRIYGGAEAKKNDITEELRVISRSILNERLIARFKRRLN